MSEIDSTEPTANPTGLIKSVFLDLFAVDVRSLALLRISIGLIILIDIANRWPWLELFHTDQGVLTIELAQQYLGPGYWSLFWIDGSLFFAQVLFCITALAAMGLMLGFKTRLMTGICLVMVWSLHVSNPLIVTGGHILMRMSLLWSLFLPMGAVWSIDHRQRVKEKRKQKLKLRTRYTHASLASMALLLQIAFVYFFSGIAKLNEHWFTGEAVSSILGLEMYVKPFGEWVLGWPFLLKLISFSTPVIEIVGPILMFVPRLNKLARGMCFALFWLMHIGIWSTMSIGIFSLMAMACWIAFIPTESWSFWLWSDSEDKPEIELAETPRQLVGNAIVGLAFSYVLLLNIANINLDKPTSFGAWLRQFGNTTMLIQEFKLFGQPPEVSPRFEYPAILMDNSEADLFRELVEKPGEPIESTYDYLATQNWRRVHSHLQSVPNEAPSRMTVELRYRLLDSIVSYWNKIHDPARHVSEARIKSFEVPIRSSDPKEEVTAIESTWAEWIED